jgi:hypothetical protein
VVFVREKAVTKIRTVLGNLADVDSIPSFAYGMSKFTQLPLIQKTPEALSNHLSRATGGAISRLCPICNAPNFRDLIPRLYHKLTHLETVCTESGDQANKRQIQ